MLIDKGADPNTATIADFEFRELNVYAGMTAIMGAASNGHYDAVALLLEKGADPKAANRVGGNALMAAAAKGHTKIVELLIDKGADVNAATTETFAALVDGPEIQPGLTPLIAAVAQGHKDTVKLLLEKGAADKDDVALQLARQREATEMITLLKAKKGE